MSELLEVIFATPYFSTQRVQTVSILALGLREPVLAVVYVITAKTITVEPT